MYLRIIEKINHMFDIFSLVAHNWNQPRSILTLDLSSVDKDQVPQGANLSSSFALKKMVH